MSDLNNDTVLRQIAYRGPKTGRKQSMVRSTKLFLAAENLLYEHLLSKAVRRS